MPLPFYSITLTTILMFIERFNYRPLSRSNQSDRSWVQSMLSIITDIRSSIIVPSRYLSKYWTTSYYTYSTPVPVNNPDNEDILKYHKPILVDVDAHGILKTYLYGTHWNSGKPYLFMSNDKECSYHILYPFDI